MATSKTTTYRVQTSPKPGEWQDCGEEFSTPDAARMHSYELIRTGVTEASRVVERVERVLPR